MLYQSRDIFEAAQRQAVILTVNQRMTRTLLDEYQRWQLQRGMSAWVKPQIFTPSLWWHRCLVQHVSSGILLNPAQQHTLWQRIIREDLQQQQYALLQVGATVKQALKAYAVLCEHLVVLDDYSAVTPEERAFKRWCAKYLEYCDAHGYMDSQRLGTYIQQAFQEERLGVPAEVWLVGFDEITPQLRCMCETLTARGSTVVEPHIEQNEIVAHVYSCADPDAELHQVARWAYNHLAAGRSVGVIVPELERQHSKIERIFREYATAAIKYGSETEEEEIPLNLSLGKPLSEYGVIQAALRLLQVAEPLDLNEFGYLLRSPWFAGGQQHMDTHAAAEAFLRTCSRPRAYLDTYIRMLEQKGYCRHGIERITAALQDLCHTESATEIRRSPKVWGEVFTAILSAAGWPGDYAPDSETYQILQTFEEQILPQFISITAVEGDVSRLEGVRLLQRLSDESVFQPAAPDKRLQVVGLLEGVALACDAVWVVGLHAHVLPAPLNYNSFIPVQVQREHAMPRASVEREIEFCTRLMHQLHALAPEVNFSYPKSSEDGNAYAPSPFLPSCALAHESSETLEKWKNTAREDPVALEVLHDSHGVPVDVEFETQSPPYKLKGGTYLLKAQAACPFRAYVNYRMGVDALEVPVEGVDMRVRGSLLHLLLQRFWEEVHTQEELLRYDEAQTRALLTRLCSTILEENLNGYVPHNLRMLEQQRLENLALEWLEIERKRSPFKVLSVEEREELQVGMLKVTAIADRVDEILPDGGVVLLDYKTGVVSLKDIVGEDLLEPQLPLYALYGKHQPAVGLGIAQVRAGECSFKGVCVADEEVHSMAQPLKGMNAAEWSQLRAQWCTRLEQLAVDIARGYADVAPAQAQVCQFCELHPLCRIKDSSEEPALEREEI
ncbi:MAG: PD-(D/E)XK nuclease family protein [Desulfuromonadaceae bacterium]